ncbi:MAG: hypothetical protein R3B81_14675 [bacterium]
MASSIATRTGRNWAVAAAAAVSILAGGCERDLGGLGPAPVNVDPTVFLDDFSRGAFFQPFLDTKIDALSLDREQRYLGTSSLKITVPGPGDDTGTYAGGAFTATYARDFSSFNALTFWIKASHDATLNVAGLGNDNTGTSRFEASRPDIPVTTSWSKVVIPMPLPSKLDAERGLLFFAEGYEGTEGYSLWIDEIQYENLATVTNPRPTLLPATRSVFVGQTIAMENTRTTFDVDGTDITVFHQPDYFTYSSSDETVARVENGEVQIIGGGTATITAQLGDVAAGGVVTLNSSTPPPSPAPDPTLAASDVISLFSDSYPSRTVDLWSTSWDTANVTDLEVDGNALKAYTGLGFAGIEFATSTIDASSMETFHLDVWIPDGFFIKVKLVDFGADGAFGGGDDSESVEVGILVDPGSWNGLDVPMTSFTGLAATGHLAQLILLGNPSVLYVDNLYFAR